MEKTSTIVWKGSAKEGSGTITSQSKILNEAPFSYHTRFAEVKGTNPEELIAAAHASCFTMKLSFLLHEAGFDSQHIETKATVTIGDSGLAGSHIEVKAIVPKLAEEKFLEIAGKAKSDG